MSDCSWNPKYDGQMGLFGNWRDISAEEFAYETKVRKIVGIVGGLFGALCILFSVLYAKGVIDGGVGLGMGIPSGIAASIMIPIGIFYNHGWHLRTESALLITHKELQKIKSGTFQEVKLLFQKYYNGFGGYDIDARPFRRVNLEGFVKRNALSVKQANFIRAHIDEYHELDQKIPSLLSEESPSAEKLALRMTQLTDFQARQSEIINSWKKNAIESGEFTAERTNVLHNRQIQNT